MLTQDEINKVNQNVMATLEKWRTVPLGWTIYNSAGAKGAGLLVVGTMGDASRACTKWAAITRTFWYVGAEPEEVEKCPGCGKLAHKSIIDSLGECFSCDHVRGDVPWSQADEGAWLSQHFQ